MHAVIAEQMGVCFHAAEIVDRDRHDIGATAFDDRAQYEATNAPEPVDGYFDGHEAVPFLWMINQAAF